jgi:hypothetical protein
MTGALLLRIVVEGPPARRFLYVNSGTSAGQHDSRWSRRAKVALGGITAGQVRRARGPAVSRFRVRRFAVSRDGFGADSDQPSSSRPAWVGPAG